MLRIYFIHQVSNQAVRDETDCTPVSELIKKRRLRLFGDIARLDAERHHCRALRAYSPLSWRRPRGRPRHAHMDPANSGIQLAADHCQPGRCLAPSSRSSNLANTHRDSNVASWDMMMITNGIA